jgi:hypothetical protein
MAMTLSEPHPERPYELTGVKLGDYQFERAAAWEDAGLLALVGIGIEPGAADVFARHAGRRPVLGDRRDRRPRRREPRRRGLRLRADVLDLDDDRGVPQPAGRLGARARLVHDEPFSEPEVFDFPEGIGPVECVNVEHEEVLLVPRWVDCRRVTFKYGLGDEFIEVLETLHKLGLDAKEPSACRASRSRRATWSPQRCPTRRRSASG